MPDDFSLVVDPRGDLIVTTRTDDAIFITKLDAEGRLLWQHTFGNNGAIGAGYAAVRDSAGPEPTYAGNDGRRGHTPKLTRITSALAIGTMPGSGV